MKNNALFFFTPKLQCLKVLIHNEKSYLKKLFKNACVFQKQVLPLYHKRGQRDTKKYIIK